MKVINQALMARVAGLGLAASLMGCVATAPPRDTSTIDEIRAQLKKAATPARKAAEPGQKSAPVPGEVGDSLLPPIKGPLPRMSGAQLEQRFDLVVTDAPISEVLLGIVHGTPYSILVKPKTPVSSATEVPGPAPAAAGMTPEPAGRVTINLKNVTVFEALESIREVYGYDYTLDGTRIYVQQPELQTRLYHVNYIIGQRRGVSDLQVIGGASVGSQSAGGTTGTTTGGGGTGGASSSGQYSSVQASALSTTAKSDIWGEVEDALRTALGCIIPREKPRATTGAAATGAGATGAGKASRADVSFQGESESLERRRGVGGCADGRAMSVSQMSGTVMVRGMPNEHRMIERILRTLQLNVERQVIIEAKVIDVELNSSSQQGVNWAAFSSGLHRGSVGANPNAFSETGGRGGGVNVVSPTTLGGVLGGGLLGSAAGSAFSAGLGVALQLNNFSALINFLQTQGEVHVLSSPRIATLNSQKAIIKVGTEEPFVSNVTPQQATAVGLNVLTTTATLNYQPFFSGVSLDVTPKIDDQGNVTLHVRAMVNSIAEREKIATPDVNSVRVPFAVNTISETDSVVKSRDGQVVVIGGLMTERMSDDLGRIPGIGNAPAIGALFRKGQQRKVKRELVILLRPTVVSDDSVWTDDIGSVRDRISDMDAAARDRPRPGDPTGVVEKKP